jgi:hypothetical protein
MLSESYFELFTKYKNSGAHAFSTGVVTDADKDLYQELFESLQDATGQSQVYVIASEAGFEIGFAVTIHEDDYYNASVKARQRSIIPILYRKLPDPGTTFVSNLDDELLNDGFWNFGRKTRAHSTPNFASLAQLIAFLKMPNSAVQGGGAIYQTITPNQIVAADFDLNATFSAALQRFTPLMRLLVPNGSEQVRLRDQQIVDNAAEEIPETPPPNMEDGRKRALQLVAIRQGQAKFREKLFDAYGARCAITGTSIAATLQAAHISPYRGPETNGVDNGLLLRADIHNLFDLGLIRIDPQTFKISLAEEIKATKYGQLEGKKLRSTAKPNQRPSSTALEQRRVMLAGVAQESLPEPTS